MSDYSETRSRDEHLAWCKERALEYLDTGDMKNAVASMLSDLSKHRETKDGCALASLGMVAVISGDRNEVRRFITGFN